MYEKNVLKVTNENGIITEISKNNFKTAVRFILPSEMIEQVISLSNEQANKIVASLKE